MRIARNESELSDSLGGVFVPTMGALHEGHAALIRAAATAARRTGHPGGPRPVVVSIFVNPTQFNDPADFERYPRPLERDAAVCESAGATLVFAPSVEAIYPRDAQGRELAPKPSEHELPGVAREPGLEDAHRPGHFAGVYQVVKRLFQLVRPMAAMFGEKDWQQFQLVRALVRREAMPIEIIARPTVREPDGLAMSSRNVHLSAEDRGRAGALWRAIRAAQSCAAPAAAERAGLEALRGAGIEPEYFAVRDAETLMPADDRSRPQRVLVAAKVGSTRLIDNAPWGRG